MTVETRSSEASAARLTIDLSAIAENYATLRRTAPEAEIAGVVKADAYGLGAVPVARKLLAEGCRTLFVATLGEAMELRAAIGNGPLIGVLNGLTPETAADYVAHGLTPVLNSLAQVREWATTGERGAILQVDSGMSRLGLSVGEQEQLLAEPGMLERLGLRLVMSHLAVANEPHHAANGAQLAAFEAARARFAGIPASLANSAGIFLGAGYQFDLCRPGAALYGISAGPKALGLKLCVSLDAPVVQMRWIEAGTGVGYGHSLVAERRMRLAAIGVGYADGWLRSLSNRGAVYWGEQRLPIVGRVSMDSFLVDITALPDAKFGEGERVELIGPHQSADDVARAAGTIGYEVLTSLGARFQRIYRGA